MKVFYGLVVMMFLAVGAVSAHEHSMGARDTGNKDLGICPVMHNKASREYSYVYKGKTYYLCCPACMAKLKSDPEKYISKIKEIKLEAYQYGFSPDTIKVKRGDIVKIAATSRDVEHGVYIKDYKIDMPVKKGEISNMEFLADKAGEFPILCSVYCGPEHHEMKAKLIVEN